MIRWFDHKIRLIVLYAVATLVCIGTVLYFVNSFKGLQHTQKQLDEAHRIFEQTNALVASLNAAQTLSETYISTRDAEVLEDYHRVVNTVFQMVDTLFAELPESFQNQLLALLDLFEQKEVLLQRISTRRDYSKSTESLREQPEPTFESDLQMRVESRTEVDTTYTTQEDRGFLRRLF